MILSPNNRSVYTDALTPPAGFQLDTAVAATFSMDLLTLLSVPLQLVLQSTENRDELLRDPISLYEALQRATRRVHIFVQHGRIAAPRSDHLLYSLLEPMITEVVAPRGGAFHPKLWVLRFASPDRDRTSYRLLLGSKNLTADRCWDVALTMDGQHTPRTTKNGLKIARFVEHLPSLGTINGKVHENLNPLVEDLPQVAWELPDGFEILRFDVLGLDNSRWRPAPSRRLVVISPFIRPKALQMLADTSELPVAVISRSESFTEIDGKSPFKEALVLHDAAETDDGEDETDHSNEIGLHAKAYMYQSGQTTHLTIGSANATDAALVARKNVEILASLSGPTYKIGSVLNFLSTENDSGLGQYLVPWNLTDAEPPDSEASKHQSWLDTARDALLAAGLSLVCSADGESWGLELHSTANIDLSQLKVTLAWPVTVGHSRAVSVADIGADSIVKLPGQSISSLTSLIAFRLEAGKQSLNFTLNLPVSGMPEERDRAILRQVVQNRQGFLRYLLLLLAGLGDGADIGSVARAFSSGAINQSPLALDDVPLLEELVRAFSRDRKRLDKVHRLIDDIANDGDAEELLPAGFLKFWQVFREAAVNHD